MSSSQSPIAIEVHDLTVSYRAKPVVWGVDFELPKGRVAAIVGPNGAGKSTLLKAIMGLLPFDAGNVKIFGRPLAASRGLVAYVPQRSEVDWDFPITAGEVVLMGRYGHVPFWRRLRRQDREAAERALGEVGMTEFRDRQIGQLSGGQQQRVFLARAIAQEADIYLMDEPFAGVDAVTERAIVDLFGRFKAAGKTVVCVHHDLTSLTRYFDWAAIMNVRLVAAGDVGTVVTPANLASAYGGTLEILAAVQQRLAEQT